jgi:hypothetical protein
MAERASVPPQYLRKLSQSETGWQRDLAAHMLRESYGHDDDGRYLVRAIGGEIRGFLSDSFRRLDSRPVVEAFATACQELGAVCFEGLVTDTRMALKAVLPMVFEPVPGEVMCFGVELRNSDFGAGKLVIAGFVNRLWCTNGAVMQNLLSQVHLGKRLPDEVKFSQETYDADSKAQALAVRDVMMQALSPEYIEATQDVIREANDKKADWTTINRRLESIGGKKLVEKAKDLDKTDRDVEHLPLASGTWRASNIASWLAKTADDLDQKMDLQRLAGEILETARKGAEKKAEQRRKAMGADLVDDILGRVGEGADQERGLVA